MKWLTDDEFFGTEVGTSVEDRALIMGSAIAQTAAGIAQNSLSIFSTTPDFLAQMQVAFGNSFDVEKAVKLASAWAQGDFSEFPEIEIRSEAEINGALGAFAAATGKIYLSREFVAKNAGNVTAVAGVLLEEFGHFVDSQINRVDAIGDEGEIFSDLVQGKALSQGELAGLKGEDDSAVVVLDGERVGIEQRSQSDTLDFFAEEVDFDSFDGDIEFFKERYALPEEKSEGFGVKFTRALDATLIGKAYAKADSGEFKFSYPITVDVEGLPENAKPNEKITLKLNTENFLALGSSGSFTGSEGLELDAGIKFSLEPAKLSFKNIEVKNPFDLAQPFNLSGFDLGGTLGKAEVDYNLSTLLKGNVTGSTSQGAIGNVKFPADVGSANLELPKVLAFKKSTPKDGSTSFPSIAASGTSNNVVNVEVDLDKALSLIYPPLKALGNKVDYGLKSVDRLSKETRGKLKLSYDLLDLKVSGGIAVQQDLEFDPKTVKVTMSAVDENGNSTQIQEGTLEDRDKEYTFQVPSEGCGVLKVKAKYELSGEVENNFGLVANGSIKVEAVKAEAKLEFPAKSGKAGFQIGPVLSTEGKLSSSSFLDPLPLWGTDSIDPSKNPFYQKIEPKKVEPNSKGGKGLTVEVEYEIPYNLPVSVSDASIEEGNSGTKDLVFPVTLRDTPKEAVTLSYSSPKGSGSVTIQAGQTSGEIKIPVTGDETVEQDETFTLTVKDQNGKLFADCKGTDSSEATGTIIDDDEGKPNPPKNGGKTFNDPRIVTIDKQYHDFQAAGEFTLIESTTGDLKIQVRQQPIGNNPRSNVSDNTAVATVLAGKRIGIYKGQGLLIDGQPTQIANDDALAIGDGRIYREGNTYTVVYPTGDQLVAKVGSRVNVEVYLQDEREGKIKGLLGNFNKNPKDDLAKPDGTVIPEPVSQQQLYGEYADSWRVNQAESLFDYNPGENTNTFTLQNYPRQKVKISDLNPADVAKAEQLIGDRIKNPTTREAAIIDLVLTDFDPDILEEALNAPDPDSVLAIASPFTANSDFTTTTVNTATKIDILANDSTAKDPLSIKEFNTKSVAGGIITLDNNNTPNDKTDDKLTYTPPPNFTGTDKFNYLLTDGKQIQAATVNININSLKLDNLSGNNGFVLNGTEAGNFSGVAVSKTGDINGDKIDDIIVGSFGADPNNVNAAGKSQVIFGNQKFPASVNLSQLNGQNGFTLNGTDAEGFSGGTVSSAGDINGDGIKDFIIGAFGATVNGQNNAGKTYIVFGTNQGFPANFNLANLNGNNGFAVTGTNTFDYAGLFATGISDINGDRIDDILISAPGPLGGTPGKSYVIYGRTTGFSANLNLAEINNNNGFVINGIDGNSSGTASSGDINGDGIPDLVIGADGGNTSGGINAGKTYVIFGQPGGFTGSVNVPELNGTTGFVIAGLTPQERSGIALTATGDINGDGNKDLVIGAPGATVGDRINAGKTYVIFGKKAAFPVIVNPADLNGSNGFIISGFDPEASAGNALSYAGDINKDGFDDLLIGASSANSDSKNNAGKTFVIFGKKEFPANFNLGQTNGKNALVLNGVETDGLVGTAVSGGGDINGDGIDDLIVGAPGSLFQDSPGKSYAVFGSRGFGFANPNNGLQGTVQDDIINGTQADETISGRQGNDKIFGNAGQDVLSGNLNDDYLDGEKGQDIVIGGDGNDTLFGGLGNDVLKGDNGNDILTGVDINAINPGIEEIDTLTGGGGSDIFVLGDVNNTYYDNGDSDYALITDFNASEDSIQLQGKADDYLLVPFSQANQTGTAIYRKDSAQNELISILQGGANLSLTGNYFKFVGAG
ncbi:MAG: FG-GAP repeat protein [Microcoleus sp. PH2017_29_MFU_D_A]|uniref:VWD domain-containing protein n=1 Tax=unclassified Microcoleus TaxID=2642155 RepID=UPI001D1D0F87|nr:MULTISPECIES: VWD domain-containing protein [unclassified Microcoleus]MCC3602883.1 FG-GAP repeat protein [Microcoleus sp. PH2017_29_MFU_D_A]MCC3634090.1 FG-GAP repeat protein [Microcoleus sp. PH2017_37_MFU_D_B]